MQCGAFLRVEWLLAGWGALRAGQLRTVLPLEQSVVANKNGCSSLCSSGSVSAEDADYLYQRVKPHDPPPSKVSARNSLCADN
jgi:hypothetical protein